MTKTAKQVLQEIEVDSSPQEMLDAMYELAEILERNREHQSLNN